MEVSKENLSKLQAVIDSLSLDDAVDLYNAICYELKYPDNMIYSIDELDDLLCDLTPSEIARTVSYGDFNYDYKYVTFDGYGNLQSIRREDDLYIDLDDVLRVYAKDPSQLPDPVREFLNELEEELDTDTEDTGN